jgi:hypothetical protein
LVLLIKAYKEIFFHIIFLTKQNTMKKIFFIYLALLSISFKANAQITLEHFFDSTYGGDLFYFNDIGNNDFKYVFLNQETNTFSLYNMDMSSYLTNIALPVGDSIKNGFTVIYITKTLFDCDSTNIEFVYTFPTSFTDKFRVIRTDGTILLELDSVNGGYGFGVYGGSIDLRPIRNTNAGAKLQIQKLNNGVGQVYIYALCGELPLQTFDFTNNESTLKVYPNPAEGKISFVVNANIKTNQFQLSITDISGRIVFDELVNFTDNKFMLDAANFTSGAYIYSVKSKNSMYQSGKFIIKK